MSENIFAKFNSMMDVEGLKKDVETAANASGDFVEVPVGKYEVRVVKLELGATGENSKTPGAPMAKVWFNIVAGEYKDQKIFMNQMLTSGFGIHKMNQFMESLETGLPVQFDSFEQYDALMREVFKAVDDAAAEFELSYTQNNKGYSVYEIIQRYPKEQ